MGFCGRLRESPNTETYRAGADPGIILSALVAQLVGRQGLNGFWDGDYGEAREYLRDKKGPSKFCGNTHSIQAPKELVLDMPIGVMWINRQPTVESQGIVKRIYEEGVVCLHCYVITLDSSICPYVC